MIPMDSLITCTFYLYILLILQLVNISLSLHISPIRDLPASQLVKLMLTLITGIQILIEQNLEASSMWDYLYSVQTCGNL
jgi:hypothetical protein